MNNILIFYCIISFSIFFLISKISYKLKLTDIPNKRKIHFQPTAYTGGIAISIIFLCKIMLFEIYDVSLNLILSVSFLICIVGFIDDKYYLNIGNKLSLQIIPIFYLIIFENLSLDTLGNYSFFKLNLGTFAIPFTIISVILLVNAFNYFDGMDGTLTFSLISVIIILYFLIPDQKFRFFLITILIPIIIFLVFNFSIFKLPKLFLGDCGSLLLGFVISFILIYLAKKNLIHPILLAWSIAIFVYEFLSINIIRVVKKLNPFKAGKDHLHHIIFNITKSIFLTNFLMFLINIFLFTIGYLSFVKINSLTSLILFLFFFIIFFIIRIIYSKKLEFKKN